MPDRVRLYVDGKLVMDSHSNPAEGRVSFSDTNPHAIRVEYAHLPNDRNVDLVWEPPANSLLSQAIDAAKNSDAIVAFVGLSPNLEGEEMNVHVEGFDGGDRTRIELPPAQEHLLEALGETGKPLIVVLTFGSALAVQWANDHADALLEAWYPGEEGGDAIAETLTGENNPAGRLPVTFYRSTDDLPAFNDYSMKNRIYRYFQGEVLYPFGYGLSYSRFSYRAPEGECETDQGRRFCYGEHGGTQRQRPQGRRVGRTLHQTSEDGRVTAGRARRIREDPFASGRDTKSTVHSFSAATQRGG